MTSGTAARDIEQELLNYKLSVVMGPFISSTQLDCVRLPTINDILELLGEKKAK